MLHMCIQIKKEIRKHYHTTYAYAHTLQQSIARRIHFVSIDAKTKHKAINFVRFEVFLIVTHHILHRIALHCVCYAKSMRTLRLFRGPWAIVHGDGCDGGCLRACVYGF